MTRGIVFDEPGTYAIKVTSIITNNPDVAASLEANGYTVTPVVGVPGYPDEPGFLCEPPKPAATRP